MWKRRLITVPASGAGWLIWVAAAPVWVVLAVVTDLMRGRRGVALRCAALVTVYLTCELVGIVASAALWVRRGTWGLDARRWLELHYSLQAWWGSTIFRALVWIFGLRLEVEGVEGLARGPYVLLVRHASSGDTLLASALVSRPHGVRLRYVLKRELLWDPCLDIVGNRLPNVFVDRSSDEPSVEVARVQHLASELGPLGGVLIYPEGTRFSEGRRRRVLAHLEARGDERVLAYAKSLSHVLPPRPGGTLGLLEAAPEADVVVCAHTGFEGSASLKEVWNGALLHKIIRVEFRRVPHSEIPAGHEAKVEWLFDEWKRVDAWVAVHKTSAGDVRT